MRTNNANSRPKFALTATEIERFHSDGVLGPFRMVSPEHMAEMREQIIRDIIIPGSHDDDPHLHYHDRHLDHAAVCRLCRRPELVERIAALIGPDLLIWRSNFQLKQPLDEASGDERRYVEVPWHSDAAYFDLRPPVLVSAWIAITEATMANGCLQVVAGSHLRTYHHDVDATLTSFHQSVPVNAIDPDAVRSLEMEPGEFVLFDGNILHGSGPNLTGHQRIALSPRITVPFVRVTGNPLYAGRDRSRHAPDEPREVVIMRGHDYTGRHHVVKWPCSAD